MEERTRKGRLRIGPYFFILPAFLWVLATLLLPVAYTTYLSFMKWDIIGTPKWVGLSNYITIFTKHFVIRSVLNTVLWVIGMLVFAGGLPLLIAVGINSLKLKGLFKIIFYISIPIAPTTAGVFWFTVYSTQPGALNSILRVVGLGQLVKSWLMDTQINTFLMIGVAVWQWLGISLILFLVGLESIPKECIEASKLEGANSRQIFYHILLPLLRPTNMLVIANIIINFARVFDIPWTMVQGGPARMSETLSITMYRESFLLFHLGLGSAVAVFIAIITLVFSLRYLRAVIY